MNTLFRNGTLPDPALDGRYQGAFLALDLGPGFTRLFEGLADLWMPWLGKTLDASQQSGDNILSKDSYLLARFFNPRYKGFVMEGRASYRAFAFHTYTGPGVADPDRIVFKIDYNLKENPALTVRRVLDELVQLADGVYLGKAHVRWWWHRVGSWQTVAYFALTR
ncbi:MAG TPA: hypothetical protein VK900_03250 [Anaerolineales bacterium]|nr:hypothetical protein [Anaerolineales bacterium]